MKNTHSKVMVIGSGTWGTALSNHLAVNNCAVYLNSIEKDVVNEINQKNSNSKYFPNLKLHKNIQAGTEFESDVDFVFIVVPSNVARTVFEKISTTNFKKTCGFVICSKGFEDITLSLSVVF